VAQADLAAFGDGSGHAEGLEALSDGFRRGNGALVALLQGDGRPQGVRPDGVLKGDVLYALDDGFYVDALLQREGFGFFKVGQAVFGKALIDLGDTAVISFKRYHG